MAFFRIFVTVTLALALLATPAAAVEETNTTATDTLASEGEVEDDPTEAIDQHTRLVRAHYDRETGLATLIIESDRPQVLTLTDAGGVFEGGEINRKRVRVTPGKNRVQIAVSEVQGNAAVTVDTGDVLYGVPIRRAGTNPLEKVAPTSAWVGGVTIAVSMFALAAWREMKKEHGEPVSGWDAV